MFVYVPTRNHVLINLREDEFLDGEVEALEAAGAILTESDLLQAYADIAGDAADANEDDHDLDCEIEWVRPADGEEGNE